MSGAGVAGVASQERIAIAWTALAGHFEGHGRPLDLREAFAQDAQRFERFAVHAPEVFADLSKQRWDAQALRLLIELAQACGLPARRAAMLAGEPINASEGRAVLHTALRAPPGGAPHSSDVHAALDAMLRFAEQVRSEGRFDDVIHLGIGGSDLGPAMATQALAANAAALPRLHYVSNVDPQALALLLPKLDARRCLISIASKTFTTQETMANAGLARAWLEAAGISDVAAQMVGLTAAPEKARAFGVGQTFGFWDWVGGRFSMWSAIGLPLAIAIGAQGFTELLAGARAMDEHFAHAPLERNLPVLLALLDVWNGDFHHFPTRCVVPYAQALARLPAYLQQLEMESNGKGVDAQGRRLNRPSSAVVWGEPGTNAQHAFFQMLHQGTQVVPVEFIAVREATLNAERLPPELIAPMQAQQRMLLANCLAQSQALMVGKTAEAAAREHTSTGSAPLSHDALAHQRSFPGNRPSTTLLLEALTPRSLGALIALYEHRVFSAGVIWGINSFDQWGVELGKTLCNQLLPRLESGDFSGLDASTAGLLTIIRSPNSAQEAQS